MRRTWILGILATCVVLHAPVAVEAQEAPSASMRPEDLRTPTSPALVVLDASPTAIVEPTSPRALATEIVSLFNDRSGGIPETYAIQVAPYWLGDHPALTFQQWLGADFGVSLLQNLTFSGAVDRATIADTTRVGLGVRTMGQIYNDNTETLEFADQLAAHNTETARLMGVVRDGERTVRRRTATTQERESALDATRGEHTALLSRRQTLTDSLELLLVLAPVVDTAEHRDRIESRRTELEQVETAIAEKQELLQRQESELAQAVQQQQQAEDELEEARSNLEGRDEDARELARKVSDAVSRRGITVELAAALALLIPDSTPNQTRASDLSAWVTVDYQPEQHIEFLAVARMRGANFGRSNGSMYIDYGARILATIEPVRLSFELLGRHVVDAAGTEESSVRFAGMAEVHASNDVTIGLTFGRDFATLAGVDGPIFALLNTGLQFGGPGEAVPAPSSAEDAN